MRVLLLFAGLPGLMASQVAAGSRMRLTSALTALQEWGAQVSSTGHNSDVKCEDVKNWVDRDNDGCDTYEKESWCHEAWIINWANMGQTGREACCACGGGRIVPQAPTAVVSTVSAAAMSPAPVATVVSKAALPQPQHLPRTPLAEQVPGSVSTQVTATRTPVSASKSVPPLPALPAAPSAEPSVTKPAATPAAAETSSRQPMPAHKTNSTTMQNAPSLSAIGGDQRLAEELKKLEKRVDKLETDHMQDADRYGKLRILFKEAESEALASKEAAAVDETKLSMVEKTNSAIEKENMALEKTVHKVASEVPSLESALQKANGTIGSYRSVVKKLSTLLLTNRRAISLAEKKELLLVQEKQKAVDDLVAAKEVAVQHIKSQRKLAAELARTQTTMRSMEGKMVSMELQMQRTETTDQAVRETVLKQQRMLEELRIASKHRDNDSSATSERVTLMPPSNDVSSPAEGSFSLPSLKEETAPVTVEPVGMVSSPEHETQTPPRASLARQRVDDALMSPSSDLGQFLSSRSKPAGSEDAGAFAADELARHREHAIAEANQEAAAAEAAAAEKERLVGEQAAQEEAKREADAAGFSIKAASAPTKTEASASNMAAPDDSVEQILDANTRPRPITRASSGMQKLWDEVSKDI